MKVAVDLDKHAWHPSPLAGQIVLVSMVAFDGPILGFGCNDEHATCRNALSQGEFVVNVVPAALAPVVWKMANQHGSERIRASGLTLLDAQVVRPPLVAECNAHLECKLDDVKRYGHEVFLFGRVVAVSVDDGLLEGDSAMQYARLAPVFFLEFGACATLAAVQSAVAVDA